MKKSILILISILLLTFFLSCAPNPEDLVVGTWEGTFIEYTNYKIEIMEDGTYKAYRDIDSSQTEFENGTWAIDGDIFILTIEKAYDEVEGSLQPIETGDLEKQEFSFSVDDDDFALFVLTPGENANTETLIGEWTASVHFTDKGSTSVDDKLIYEFSFLEEGVFELYAESTSGSDTDTGTWEYDNEALELTLTVEEGDPIIYDIEIVGDSVVATTQDGLWFGYALDKVE
jgi:hypothetical protein